MGLYQKLTEKGKEINLLSITDSVLVVCGGSSDKDELLALGFKNVIISNVSPHAGVEDYHPYKWEYQDAEGLTYQDDSFDWVFVKAGLHHCASPHWALCEMLRVSRKGVGVIEAQDSTLMKIAQRFSLTPSYEVEPLAISGGEWGGVRNTNIPNFIYRWTRREVKKTVSSFMPQYKHEYYFFYELSVPTQRLAMSKNILVKTIAFVADKLIYILRPILEKQANSFAFLITKKGELQPYLLEKNNTIEFNTEYARKLYNVEKYKSE
jgi:ubiquinone/menaquinone biosynthesis C-methylase UbiE